MIHSRRYFLKRAAAACAGTAFLAACSRNNSRWRFFTEKEARLVEHITDQIIPADDDPGAVEAGCLNFIDKQLVGPYTRFQEDYRNGLVALTNTCQARFGKAFEELEWDEQTRILEALESGMVDQSLWTNVAPRHFFGLLRDHTMQGFYGSPRHGGNKNYISYKMIGLDYPPVIGQNRYRQGMDKPNGWQEGAI